jgi:hypothetical protein
MYFDVILYTKIIKLCKTKLIAIIIPQHLNLATNMIFQESFKLLKLTKNSYLVIRKYTHVFI